MASDNPPNSMVDYVKWFAKAAVTAKDSADRVTACFDFDYLIGVVEVGGSKVPLKFTRTSTLMIGDSVTTVWLDPRVLEQMRFLQNNQHRVCIVTLATYEYHDVETLLKPFGIHIKRANFHNRALIYAHKETNGPIHEKKSRYMDAVFADHRSTLLFDDRPENEPLKCLGITVGWGEAFPVMGRVMCRDFIDASLFARSDNDIYFALVKRFLRVTIARSRDEKKRKQLCELDSQWKYSYYLFEPVSGLLDPSLPMSPGYFAFNLPRLFYCIKTLEKGMFPGARDAPACLKDAPARLKFSI